MIWQVYAVYDSKAKAYLPWWLSMNDHTAIRQFIDSTREPTHMFHKFPADYTLFHTGEWDDQTCHYDEIPAQQNLGTALQHHTEDTL